MTHDAALASAIICLTLTGLINNYLVDKRMKILQQLIEALQIQCHSTTKIVLESILLRAENRLHEHEKIFGSLKDAAGGENA